MAEYGSADAVAALSCSPGENFIRTVILAISRLSGPNKTNSIVAKEALACVVDVLFGDCLGDLDEAGPSPDYEDVNVSEPTAEELDLIIQSEHTHTLQDCEEHRSDDA